jgi:hypothetical protein
MSLLKIKITEPCVVVGPDNKATHAAVGDIVTVTTEEASALVGAGRGLWDEADKQTFVDEKRKNQNR